MDDKDFKKKLSEGLIDKTVIIGEERVLSELRKGKGKTVVFATNCRIKEDILELVKLHNSETGIFAYPGTNKDLGEICKKPFSVAVLLLT